MVDSPPSSLQLLCFPYAGASETVYLPWQHQLPNWIRLVPVPLPGRGSRLNETPISEEQRLVEQLHTEYRHLPQQGPYALFGHSMGAVLAYELALTFLDVQAPAPVALFVSGSAAPAHRQPHPAWIGNDEELLDLVRSMNGTPPELLEDDEWRALFLPVLRADFRLCATYRPRPGRPRLSCPIYVLTGHDDPATQQQAHLTPWREVSHTPGGFKAFPGDHFFLKPRQREVVDFVSLTLGELIANRAAASFEHLR